MPVLPQEITAETLRRRWRGYDRAQVATLLRRVGTDYAGALDRIATVAEDRARLRADQQELRDRLGQLTETARTTAEQARTDADAAAASIRARAERGAGMLTRQAEETAEALCRRAHTLHTTAQADADAARRRLEDADRRAHQLEDAARDRWETLRTETEARFEQLQIAERRFAQRIRHIETSLGALRSQVGLLDQVHQVEQVLAAVRTDAYPVPTVDGDHHNEHQR